MRLLWLSMLKMPSELMRLCVCHLLSWFSIISEAVFFTDFMGQVIYHGDPIVREHVHIQRSGTSSVTPSALFLILTSPSGSFQFYPAGKLSQRSSDGMLGAGYIRPDCCYVLR